MTKCYRTTLKTFVCEFMTLHLWVQTKHAKIYDFCFSLSHIVLELQNFKWNQTELPVVQNSWNFTSLSISLHFTTKKWLDVVRQNLKIGLKLLGGLRVQGGIMPQMTHSDMATHHELQLKKKRSTHQLYLLMRYTCPKKTKF